MLQRSWQDQGPRPSRRRYPVGYRFAALVLGCVVAALLPAGCKQQTQPAPNIQGVTAKSGESGSTPESKPPSRPESSREATLARIRRLISSRKLSEAERAIQSHLLRSPRDADAMVLGAQVYAAGGQIDEAVDMLDSAASLSGGQGKYWNVQASMLLSQAGRWPEAIARLEALLVEHPDFDEARHQLADLLNVRGFRFDANEHVRQLCRRSGATLDQLRGLMVPTRSHVHFTDKPNLADSKEIEALGRMTVARALFSAGDVREASEILAQSRLVREKHPAAIAFYGQVLLESQQFEAFESWLQNVGSESRRYPAYWMAMGGWAMRGRQYETAVRMFAEAILREPGDLAANDRMAQALAAAGRSEASERFRQRGVEIDAMIRATTEVLDGNNAGPLITEISHRLSQVGRPLESLAWYRIGLQAMGSPADAMRKLEEGIAQVEDADLQASSRRTLLCEIDLEQFPLNESALASGGMPISPTALPPAKDRREPLQPVFVNVARQVGLDFRYHNAPLAREREFRIFQQVGAGVACFDFDLDGRVDLYVGQASAEPPEGRGTRPNLLARNVGHRFVDVTASAGCDDRGYTCGITSGDWNQDGFADLVVANMSRNTLFLNQGDGTFRSHPGDSVWNLPHYTSSLAVADVDADHLPDIIEVNYLDDPKIFDPIEYRPDGTPVDLPGPLNFRPAGDRVFLSRGDGTISGQPLGNPEETVAATGLGILVTDVDGKPGNEIFVANDHMANHFWRPMHDQETGSGGWTNTAAARGIAYGSAGTPLGCMGIAAADFNEDGRLDLHVTNFENQWSNHYMQSRNGFFDDLVVAFGLDQLTYKMLGFGAQAIDYDNNSAVDLVIGNGHVDDYTAQGKAFEMPTQVLAIQGSRFVPMQVAGDPGYWDAGHLSRALATCDWNNDGRTDFVVTDLQQPLALLENRTEASYHWLQIQLVGTRSERDGIGATVKASFAGRTVTKVVQSGDGYMCKNESLVCLGLGESRTAERVEIVWPDGGHQTLTAIAADRRWLIIEGEEAYEVALR